MGIVRGPIILGVITWGTIIMGVIALGGNCQGGNCPELQSKFLLNRLIFVNGGRGNFKT